MVVQQLIRSSQAVTHVSLLTSGPIHPNLIIGNNIALRENRFRADLQRYYLAHPRVVVRHGTFDDDRWVPDIPATCFIWDRSAGTLRLGIVFTLLGETTPDDLVTALMADVARLASSGVFATKGVKFQRVPTIYF